MDKGLMTVGAILVGVGALLGLLLAGFEMARKEFPRALGFLHPTLAMAGLLMLVARFFIRGGGHWLDIGLLLLVGAAVAGLLLLVRGFGGRGMIRSVTLLHGVMGLLGLGFVLYEIAHRAS
jgi:hypothetical protein